MNSSVIIPALLRYDEMLRRQMEVLGSLGFVHDEIILSRLSGDPQEGRGVLRPQIEVSWHHSAAKRQVSFRVYFGWTIFCKLRNQESKQEFSFLDYLAHVKPEQRGAAWRCGFLVNDGFEAFTALVKREFATTLRPVLLGESWLDVPFDWQGQK